MATKEDPLEHLGVWRAMYKQGSGIDRRKVVSGRTVPLEVLHMSFPRTGSISMLQAYTILGYPNPYHFLSLFKNLPDCEFWLDIMRRKCAGQTIPKSDFDKLLGHCGTVSDVPCIIFYRELIEYYPEAKVVLVERDEQKWEQSFFVVLDGLLTPVLEVLQYLDPFHLGRVFPVGKAWVQLLLGSSNKQKAKEASLPAFRKHYAEVKRLVPKERLLVYQLGSGWEPLCEFLGKPVPKDIPFPHSNEAKVIEAAFVAQAKLGFQHFLYNLAIVGSVGAAVGGVAWYYWR